MRNLLSGIVGIVFGTFMLLGSLLRGGLQGGGAYLAGQVMGLVFGIVFLVAGVFYLVKGIKEVKRPPERELRRKRRPLDEDEN